MKVEIKFLASLLEVKSTLEIKRPPQKKKSSAPRKTGAQSISQKFTVNISQK